MRRLHHFKKRVGLALLLLPILSNAATLSPPVARQVQKAIELQSLQQLPDAVALLTATRTPTKYDRAFIDKTLGTLYWQQGNVLQAINVLMSAVNSGALGGEEIISTQRMLADVLLSQGRKQDALIHYYALLERDALTGETSDVWLRIAQAHYQEKQFTKALTAIDSYLAHHSPTLAALTIKLGSEISLERWKAATNTLKQLIEKEPNNKTWWIQLVANYQKLAEPEKMLSTLVLAERSNIALSHNESLLMAQLYAKQGSPQKAADLMASLNAEMPTDSGVAAEASYWQQAKEWDRAIDAWERASTFNSNFIWVAAQLALQHQKYQKGLTLLEHVDDRTPPHRVALAKAMALDKLGRTAEALEQAKRAHASSPSSETESWVKYLSQRVANSSESKR